MRISDWSSDVCSSDLFHSLEDRIVKQFLRNRSGSEASGSRHLPQRQSGPAPTFERPAKAVRPGMVELARNPRSRSATLRSAVRTRSEEHTSELQSLMRISYAVFCLKKKTTLHS